MDILASKHLDHHGVVAGVIDELNLVELIDDRLDSTGESKVSPGQATAAMLINCLGFTSKPLSLTPHFFQSKAMDVLFNEGIQAEDLNRHRLGRALDAIADYGCEMLYAELARSVCAREGVHQRFLSLDTTSFTVTGDYDQTTDEQTIELTHGYSKDHRPDLKQMVQELLVSQDGGIPLMSASLSGNASDSEVFRRRSRALLDQWKQGACPSYLVADSKLYTRSNADNLRQLPFITRIPRTIKMEQQAVQTAVQADQWHPLDASNRYYRYCCHHLGMDQRWIVVHSQAALARAQQTIDKHVAQEAESIRLELKHLRNQHFGCAQDAQAALDELQKRLMYHQLTEQQVDEKLHYAGQGRPKKGQQAERVTYIPTAYYQVDEAKRQARLDEKACYVIGTNVDATELNDIEVIQAYKQQNESLERGFRFLKDPYFFASSFFLKKPSRIMGLLTVMTLALLVYSVAQRRLRQRLAELNETLPNQIQQPTQRPTLRWAFQMLEGISVVYVKAESQLTLVITGLTDLKSKIIDLITKSGSRLYGGCKNMKISPGGFSM
jgi:transposase